MNIYIVVEGVAEKKIFPAWINILKPELTQVFTIDSRGNLVFDGVSPDLTHVNQTVRIGVEMLYNGEDVSLTLINNSIKIRIIGAGLIRYLTVASTVSHLARRRIRIFIKLLKQ